MKKIKLFTLGLAAASSLILTGCLEETIPTNGVTEAALQTSPKAGEALLNAMPAQQKECLILGRSVLHFDIGYPGMLHIRDVMTADLAVANSPSGYDWYESYEMLEHMGNEYIFMQYIWNTYYRTILVANNSVAVFPAGTGDKTVDAYRGMSLATRAAMYLELAQLYEWLPNAATTNMSDDGFDITGLTVPIVTNETSQQNAADNPRATHAEMSKFILEDLTEAEQLLTGYRYDDVDQPNIEVVYGLKARYYMWEANYAEAARYARLAIETGGHKPLTSDEWLSTTQGFNTAFSSWMWGIHYVAEDYAVKTRLLCWASWMCNETLYGYAGEEPFNLIGKELYDRMNNTDFRKLSYKAPQGSPLAGREPIIYQNAYSSYPDYTSFKFRPGNGDIEDPNVGNVVSYPMMRVEEMYLIEAEATAHTNPAAGKELLEKFVTEYRDAEYKCESADIVDACFQQKRIEFWGEGITFFDYKRLNKGVDRTYEGSNFKDGTRFKTTGRPGWMNFIITRQETQSNKAVNGYNNPSINNLFTSVDE